jgi:nicotinate-nucleotide adenylyltransferase
MRIGVFGGTFDPVHQGHLILAEQCREQGRLDQVWFIPSARPPHKRENQLTPFARRVEMLALAIAGQPAFRIDELENEQAGPNYTVRTLEEIHRRHPDSEFALIIGSDCLPDLPHWYEPQRLVSLATLLIAARPGFPVGTPEQLRNALGLPETAALRWQTVEMPFIAIASRDLRRRAAEGRSLRYLVPRPVEVYIETHHLYRDEAQANAGG